MQAGIFRLPRRGDNAGGDLHRDQAAVDQVRVGFRASLASWKHQAKITLASGQLPFPKRVRYDRRQRNRPLAGFRLRRTEVTILVDALPDMKLILLEIDIGPLESTKLRRSQPGKDRCQKDWHPAALQTVHNGPDLFAARNIHPNLEMAFLALVRAPLGAFLA